MALRLRRDVQKAAYYVWFLGAEEAKGLRGPRVINSVLPYLIERSRSQDVLKVTLQVSYKGIKIIQGSSKHFIPHSAITSSTQTNDIVACVLLLYNPITKCPLHVHAYRCDSETTAQALHQQLQILINRPENQKRFQELETRLGISLPITSKSPLPNAVSKLPSYHTKSTDDGLHHRERDETSPKRFSSSLGSDTGNSTRESDCSSDQLQGSPISHSPTVAKVHAASPIAQNSELFDSLAAELRAKLNGNGPPLLLPPRDYDTVHRSKGNLAAIELRRCRNKLIVGSTRPTTTDTPPSTSSPEKQVFSLASSSGIGSDLAPSPERQDLNSSSDEEQWTNEMENPVIALKSQIAMSPIMPAHPQLNRKSAIPPPQDSYLRDLPSKPYVSRQKGKPEPSFKPPPSSPSKYNNWSREDEIKPIIMRPADYDAKFNRVLQAEQRHEYVRPRLGEAKESTSKLKDVDKYNEVSRSAMEKLSLHDESPDHSREDLIDSGQLCDHIPLGKHRDILGFSKENLTDKQKCLEYAKKYPASYGAEDSYSGSAHYPDADHHLEQFPAKASKYHARHEEVPHHSMKQYDLEKHVIERERDRERERERERDRQRERCKEIDGSDRDLDSLGKGRHPANYPLSGERNPYREPDSLPYIKSMEKMMKSSALRYKTSQPEPPESPQMGENFHSRVSQRSKSYPKNVDNGEREYLRNHSKEREYLRNTADVHPKEREYLRNTADVHPKEREYLRNTADVHSKEREYLRNTAEVHPKDREYLRNTAEVHPKDRYKPTKKILHGSERSEDHRYDSQPVREVEKPVPGYKMWTDEDNPAGMPIGQQQFSHKMRSRSREKLWKSEAPAKERDYGYDMKERDPPVKRMYSRDLRHESRYDEQSAPMMSDYGPPEMYPARQMERHEFSPDRSSHFTNRSNEKRKGTRSSSSSKCDLPVAANMETGGYRNSYAEPVFVRSGGRVGLAAVDPY